MKKLNVTLIYKSVGNTSIEVPDELTLGEAIAYAKENIKNIHLPYEAEYLEDSDEIDEDNCDFEATFKCSNCKYIWSGTRDKMSDEYRENCINCNSINFEEI